MSFRIVPRTINVSVLRLREFDMHSCAYFHMAYGKIMQHWYLCTLVIDFDESKLFQQDWAEMVSCFFL